MEHNLNSLLEEIDACRDKGLEFLETCERIARRYGIPQDFVEALYDSLDGVPLDEDKWQDALKGDDGFNEAC